MSDTPWLGDTCSLVDAFRSGERSPVEELEATLAAIERDRAQLLHLPRPGPGARARPRRPTCSKPFGGVPDRHQGARAGGRMAVHRGVARLPRSHRRRYDSTMLARLQDARAESCRSARRLASEFGGLNVSINKLNGVLPQPLAARPHRRRFVGRVVRGGGRRPASPSPSAATAAARSASRPGSTAWSGMKGTAGRIPRGPHTQIGPMTVVIGCMARSVRDVVPLVRRHDRLRQPRPVQPAADRRLGARPRHPRPAGQEGGDRPDPRRGHRARRGAAAGRRGRRGPGQGRRPRDRRRRRRRAVARHDLGPRQPVRPQG